MQEIVTFLFAVYNHVKITVYSRKILYSFRTACVIQDIIVSEL